MKIIRDIGELAASGDVTKICLLTPIDQFRHINRILLESHKILTHNGLLGIRIQPLEAKEENIRERLGKGWFSVLYPLIFIRFRLLPKIRFIGSLLLFLTRGKNRWISKTEIFGRLYYCGFDVIHYQTDNEYLNIISRKDHPLIITKEPSYHGLITLERVGFEGAVIEVHKFRTMYPYSEFLQKKIFEQNKLDVTGKINNDYRITDTGKFLRKYWLDELPQILDWLRGYVKIVGIRAMSKHYFSLYPAEYKCLYLKVKPGLLSPLFDENISGFEEIVKTESEYLEKYLSKPIRTDVEYFFKTISQIIKGIRSK